MQRSSDHILTTHTGSLPRPRELTRLYALRSRGDAVDAAEIERAGRDAVRAVVRKQREVGIEVGNNGEQQRDSFFQYLKARLSGLGGSSAVDRMNFTPASRNALRRGATVRPTRSSAAA